MKNIFKFFLSFVLLFGLFFTAMGTTNISNENDIIEERESSFLTTEEKKIIEEQSLFDSTETETVKIEENFDLSEIETEKVKEEELTEKRRTEILKIERELSEIIKNLENLARKIEESNNIFREQAIEEKFIPKIEERVAPKIEEKIAPKIEERVVSKIEEKATEKIKEVEEKINFISEEKTKKREKLFQEVIEYRERPAIEKREEIYNIIKELSISKEEEIKNIELEDPREEGVSIDEIFEITEVLTGDIFINEEGIEEIKNIVIKGKGPPNSILFLYIFSTPIIVSVKTDSEGNWNYTLEKEIEDGSHQIYVASVDNTGKIVAKSNPLPFVKEAAAISGEFFPTTEYKIKDSSFFERNLFMILVFIFTLVILGAITFIGYKKK